MRFGVKSGVKQEYMDGTSQFYLDVKKEYQKNGMTNEVLKDIGDFCKALSEVFNKKDLSRS